MNARDLAYALSPKPQKILRGWLVPCPAHDDRTPSLAICSSISGKPLLKCFAGCPQSYVIAELRKRGLWGRQNGGPTPPPPKARAADEKERQDAEKRRALALRLWDATESAERSPVETYLRCARGLSVAIPSTIRGAPSLRHPSGTRWPAMVACVVDVGGRFLGVHRTFLTRDGFAKAPVDPQKMMLGSVAGGFVQLAGLGENSRERPLLICEGIETGLSLLQATKLSTLAALSTSGVRSILLPKAAAHVVICPDGDAPGLAAAQELAWRLKREGRHVRIATPPAGADFNDMLRGGARVGGKRPTPTPPAEDWRDSEF